MTQLSEVEGPLLLLALQGWRHTPQPPQPTTHVIITLLLPSCHLQCTVPVCKQHGRSLVALRKRTKRCSRSSC